MDCISECSIFIEHPETISLITLLSIDLLSRYRLVWLSFLALSELQLWAWAAVISKGLIARQGMYS